MPDMIKIGEFQIGNGCPALIIAEAGVNHEGDLRLAKQLVDAAADAGANAIKFQTYHMKELISAPAMQRSISPRARQYYPWLEDSSWLDKMDKSLTAGEYHELYEYAASRKLLFLSSAWDEASVDLMEKIGAPAYKVGSGDLTHLPLLRYIAGKRKPILLSVGLGTASEIRRAAKAIREVYPECPLVLLHCIVSYPAPPEELNLRFVQTLRRRFRLPVGFSDHSVGIETGAYAVAAGADVIEKHLTLNRALPGLDQRHSLLPEEFRAMVQMIRRAEAMLGTGRSKLSGVEREERVLARRSCTAARDLRAGEQLSPEKFQFQRPAVGVSPARAELLVGRRLRRNRKAGEPISWRDLERRRA